MKAALDYLPDPSVLLASKQFEWRYLRQAVFGAHQACCHRHSLCATCLSETYHTEAQLQDVTCSYDCERLVGVGVDRLRHVWDRAADRHMENLEWTTAAAAAASSGHKAGDNAVAIPTKALAVKVSTICKPESYNVPDGFSSDSLPQVDLLDRNSAVASVPLAFVTRWLQLRSEVPIPAHAYFCCQHAHRGSRLAPYKTMQSDSANLAIKLIHIDSFCQLAQLFLGAEIWWA